jgi:hypothetical protein
MLLVTQPVGAFRTPAVHDELTGENENSQHAEPERGVENQPRCQPAVTRSRICFSPRHIFFRHKLSILPVGSTHLAT